jgi:hypothetical protein
VKDLVDRNEFSTEAGHFVEEFIRVACPECGRTATRVVTGIDATWYVHEEYPNSPDGGFCEVKRGQEFIEDALVYAKTNNNALKTVTSTAVKVW